MKNTIDEILKFIKEFVKNSGRDGVVLGLSGGIDSAVVAVLAIKALGVKKVHCIYMPEVIHISEKLDSNKKDINKLYNKFNLNYESYAIEGFVKLFNKKIPYSDKISLANIKARIRMIILYAYANKNNYLVIGTTNKSEMEIGYFTKYGDGAVDFEPLGDTYKTDVFKMAKYLDIPDEIIDKPPTAGLWQGQTDEDELGMSYEEIDKALKWIDFVSSNVSAMTEYMFNEGIQKKEPKYVKKVFELVKKSKHKNQIPLTPKTWRV